MWKCSFATLMRRRLIIDLYLFRVCARACVRTCACVCLFRFSSAEPKALGELMGWDSSRRPSVRAFTLSDMNISKTRRPIIIKFHLKHHWGGGLAALGFGPDRIRTLVYMATDSSHSEIL